MTDKLANTMWGGRFAAGPDSVMEAINASIGFDQRLASQDIKGSRAHAAMLGATGIICNKDMEIIREGLLTILSEIDSGTFPFSINFRRSLATTTFPANTSRSSMKFDCSNNLFLYQ